LQSIRRATSAQCSEAHARTAPPRLSRRETRLSALLSEPTYATGRSFLPSQSRIFTAAELPLTEPISLTCMLEEREYKSHASSHHVMHRAVRAVPGRYDRRAGADHSASSSRISGTAPAIPHRRLARRREGRYRRRRRAPLRCASSAPDRRRRPPRAPSTLPPVPRRRRREPVSIFSKAACVV